MWWFRSGSKWNKLGNILTYVATVTSVTGPKLRTAMQSATSPIINATYEQWAFVETYPTHAARWFDLIVRIFSKETEEVEVKGKHSDGVTWFWTAASSQRVNATAAYESRISNCQRVSCMHSPTLLSSSLMPPLTKSSHRDWISLTTFL